MFANLRYHVNELRIMLVLINVITLGTLWHGKKLSPAEIPVPFDPYLSVSNQGTIILL